MDRYPRINRPCPVADRLADMMDGDFCRQCDKHVIDLDRLGEADRFRTLAAAQGELCISYRRPATTAALVAATLVASVAAFPAAAQEAPAVQAAATTAQMDDEIVVGGAPILTKAQRARYEREARKAERQEKAAARRATRAGQPPQAETN